MKTCHSDHLHCLTFLLDLVSFLAGLYCYFAAGAAAVVSPVELSSVQLPSFEIAVAVAAEMTRSTALKSNNLSFHIHQAPKA